MSAPLSVPHGNRTLPFPSSLHARNQCEPTAFGFTFRLHLMILLPRLSALFAAALLAVPLRAHDPAESWTEIMVGADHMELLVTMAQASALKLIDPAVRILALTKETFAAHRAKLLTEGAKLFAITSLTNRLAVQRIDVLLTEEADVAYRIIYPRPAPGLLMFEAAFIKTLGNGCGGIITARDAEKHELGWDQLSPDHATLVVMLPKPGTPAKRSP